MRTRRRARAARIAGAAGMPKAWTMSCLFLPSAALRDDATANVACAAFFARAYGARKSSTSWPAPRIIAATWAAYEPVPPVYREAT